MKLWKFSAVCLFSSACCCHLVLSWVKSSFIGQIGFLVIHFHRGFSKSWRCRLNRCWFLPKQPWSLLFPLPFSAWSPIMVATSLPLLFLFVSSGCNEGLSFNIGGPVSQCACKFCTLCHLCHYQLKQLTDWLNFYMVGISVIYQIWQLPLNDESNLLHSVWNFSCHSQFYLPLFTASCFEPAVVTMCYHPQQKHIHGAIVRIFLVVDCLQMLHLRHILLLLSISFWPSCDSKWNNKQATF